MGIKIITLPLGPLQTNCYVLACDETRQAAVIDPSWDGDVIYNKTRAEGWTIEKILLTHTHFDHVGGLDELKRLTSAPIYIHADAVPMLEMAEAAGQMWGVPIGPQPSADEFLADGQTIQVGNLALEVLFTPGHAPGHVSYYLPSYHVVFDGDVLFNGSIGRTDLPGGDFNLLMDSIGRRLLTMPDKTLVLSGHGEATTIGQEKSTNPFLLNLNQD